MVSKFNKRRTRKSPSPKRRTPSRKRRSKRETNKSPSSGDDKKRPQGSGKPLVVFQDNVSTVKKDGIFLEAASSVKVVVYTNNKLTRLQSTVQKLAHLRALDLSNNHLSSLPSIDVWSHLTCLQHFNLGHNRITQWEHIVSLSGLKSLISLVLTGNPLALDQPSKYRHFVVNRLQKLMALDYQCIADAEVIEGLQRSDIEDAEQDPIFTDRDMNDKLDTPYDRENDGLNDEDDSASAKPWTADGVRSPSPIFNAQVSHHNRRENVDSNNRLLPVIFNRFAPGSEYGHIEKPVLLSDDSPQHAIGKIDRYLRTVRIIHSRVSALVCIQSFFRGHLTRQIVDRQLKYGPAAATKMQAATRGFLLRRSIEEDLKAVLMLSESGKDLLVSEWDRMKIDAARIIQEWFRGYKARFEDFGAGDFSGEKLDRTDSATPSNTLKLSPTKNWRNPMGDENYESRNDAAPGIDKVTISNRRRDLGENDFDDASSDESGFFARDSDSDVAFDLSSAWPAKVQQAWQPRPITIGTTRPRERDTIQLPNVDGVSKQPVSDSGPQITQVDDAHPQVMIVGQATRPSTTGRLTSSSTYAKSELRILVQSARAESRAISRIREKSLVDEIAAKRNRVRFIREIVPAQRKLARLMRPDTKASAALALARKKQMRAEKEANEKAALDSRRKAVAKQRQREIKATKYRAETERYRKIDLARRRSRPSSASSLSGENPSENRPELSGSGIAARVRRRKRLVKSARRHRQKSQMHALSFVAANNATSRHIAKGNALRRKRIEHANTRRKVEQTRIISAQRQELMCIAANRRKADKQRKIAESREEYKRMLMWRREMDVHELEMTRLKKRYDSDLRALVRRVRKGEIDQPIWDVEYMSRADFQNRKYENTLLNPMPPITNAPHSSFEIRKGPTKRKVVDTGVPR